MNIVAMGIGSPTEIAIIAIVVLLLFGGARLAGFGKSVGEGIRSFKNEVNASDEDAEETPTGTSGGTGKTKQ